jgi:hypothetical protein
MNIEEIFGSIEEISIRQRVNFFRKIRDLNPDKPGKVLEEAMKEIPGKIIELIRKTPFTPMVLAYRGRTFDHELENFLFCFDEANVHLYPAVTKALWEKLMNETPERNLYMLDFLAHYIETHPNWEKFARFIFNNLFGGPRRGWESVEAVLKGLVSVNGLWPRIVIKTIEELPIGEVAVESKLSFLSGPVDVDKEKKEKLLTSFREEYEEIERQYSEGGRYFGDKLSKEESRRVIDKINELFF